MPDSSTPVEVFYSYAHKDEAFRNELEKHLSLLQRQGLITVWHDRHILPGADWSQAIDENLERASVILLLISADFLASDYCYGLEMQRALERHQANEARVILILLRPVDWTNAPFAHLQALPTGAKPITKWSNRDEAFADVAAGIRRVIEDPSSLAASAPRAALPPVWNVPYPRNPFFTAREEQLAQIREQLQRSQSAAIGQVQAISGLGGIGKTQIAIEYAYRHRQEYQAVLWVHADTLEALNASYSELAHLLNLGGKNAKEQEIVVQAVQTWLAVHHDWLLILDNLDEPLVLFPLDEKGQPCTLSPFLPATPGGHILLTTRSDDLSSLSLALGLARALRLTTFTPEQGAYFLLARAERLEQATPQDQQLAAQIARELGGLALAIDQAGAYLAATGDILASYLQLFQQRRVELLKQQRNTLYPESVATTWVISFRRVEERNPAASDLLRLCAYLAPDAIAEEILTQGAEHLGPVLGPVAADAFLLGQAIEALRAYSLVGRDPSQQTLSVHRLVQAVVRDALDAAGRQSWMERAIRAVHAALPPVEHANWPQWERLLAHAQACATWLDTQEIHLQEAAVLLQQTGWYLTERARYSEAEPLLARAYQLSEQQQGAEHLDTARDAATLAYLYQAQGKYEQAEPLLVRALAIREQQLGPEHPSTARSLNNLAELYREQGKYEQAEPLYQRALATREQQLGPEHPHTAQSLNNLAALYDDQGKYEQAKPLYVRALAIYEQQLGPLHPDTAGSLNNLAELYREQSKYEQAEPLYVRALAICEQQLGLLHPHTLIVRENYVVLLRAMGRDAEAVALETKHMPPS